MEMVSHLLVPPAGNNPSGSPLGPVPIEIKLSLEAQSLLMILETIYLKLMEQVLIPQSLQL
jgi:hypothetical protein